MNKRTISIIIGALSIAIISLVALQANLMLKSIRTSEGVFDKNVHNAMSLVAEQIEFAAKNKDLFMIANGYSIPYFEIDEELAHQADDENGGMSIPISKDNAYSELILSQIHIRHSNLCEECRKRNEINIPGLDNDRISYDYVDVHSPIEERIDAQEVKKMLTQELANNAIDIDYEFGVFSTEKEAFVIHDGQYIPEDFLINNENASSFLNLQASPFSVSLFEDKDQQIAGQLKLFFPKKDAAIWSSMIPNLIGTFLFASIILACFVYTIWAILRQKRVSEMKTDFINNMTHEFKTPIATISLAADSIMNPRVSGNLSKLKRFVNIIKEENKRMNKQVEKVLQMAKIDREEASLRLIEVDLHDIIIQAVENIGLQAEKRGGTAKAVLNATQSTIQGDQTHIANVINNLLDNANKYSPDAPIISVETKNVAKGIEVTISDKGLGLTKEARKHIFDKFYRVHTGDQHDVKGFGLGLSYVKTIMTRHKGTVNVKSDPGKGSDFILFFPYTQ